VKKEGGRRIENLKKVERAVFQSQNRDRKNQLPNIGIRKKEAVRIAECYAFSGGPRLGYITILIKMSFSGRGKRLK